MHKLYLKIFLNNMNSTLKIPNIKNSGEKACITLFEECVDFGVNVIIEEISNVHSLRDNTPETK